MVVGGVLQVQGKPSLWRSGLNPGLMNFHSRTDCVGGDPAQYMTPLPPRSIPPNAPFFIVMNGGSGRHDVTAVQQTIQRIMAESGRQHTVHVVTDASRLVSVA